MKVILVRAIIIGFLTSACGTKTKEFKANESLISFKSWTAMTMDELVETGEQNYRKIDSNEFDPKTDTITYANGQIYVSYLSIVNGCGQYAGDVEIRSDSIFLKLIDVGEIACTEERCDRLIYKIKNEGDKRFKVVKGR